MAPLLSRIKAAPLPLNADLARGIAAPCAAQDLVTGIAGSSPYLRGLLRAEESWLETLWEQPPETAFDTLLTPIQGPPEAPLRRVKRRAALLSALCDLGGVWDLETVTGALSRLADFALETALQFSLAEARVAGRAPLPKGAGGVVALAMGKMGAGELNYSSDIDLILLYDDDAIESVVQDTARSAYQRVARRAVRILSEQTVDGYVFRTDLRLRPNPSVTPVCVPMGAAERYYEREGRTWERAAFIKARAAAGDREAGARFLAALTPFVWRRHLDFAAIQDAHDMRLAIRAQKRLAHPPNGPIAARGHDIKLGRGGIREIEFFAQTRQLIAGGRDPSLRAAATCEALRALVAGGWVPEEVASTLTKAYRAHRRLEHRIQMLRDAQTHSLPPGGEALDQAARLSGWGDTDAFLADTAARLETVHRIAEAFFTPGSRRKRIEAPLAAPEGDTMDSWRGLPALRSTRAVDIFERLRPQLVARIAATAQPERTMTRFDGFMRALPAGVQLFSLFESNPQILDLITDICATAPGLAAQLARNTAVLDAVVSGRFFDALPGQAAYESALSAQLDQAGDYEDVLACARRWHREEHFRISVLVLRGLADLDEAEAAYSALAEAVLSTLLPHVCADAARRYGRFARQEIAVLGMGKLGSRQMTATSDLDLIVIYRTEGDAADGRQGLAAPQYFARLTQALITALSTPMGDGRLYEVDMRLRPSGRGGPVAVSLAGFKSYQERDAWVWEHMALTRARVVAGDATLRQDVAAVRAEVLAQQRERPAVFSAVRDMRDRIARARGRVASPWEVKDRPGGILDIELLAQGLALLRGGSTDENPRAQLRAAMTAGFLPPETQQSLVATLRLLCAVQQVARVLVDGPFEPDTLGNSVQTRIADFVGQEVTADRLAELQEDAQAQIGRILG